jgi:putative ABC transport system permease protein
LTEGRGFEGLPDTVSAYILNEEAARLLKAKSIVGQYAANPSQGSGGGKIMGIAKNFNYASLHQKIEPLVIEYRKQYPDYMLIRINGEQTAQAIKHTEAVVEKLAPGTSLVYSFMDEKLNALYKTENGLYQIVRIFSVLTIIIACLGLFALAANSIESKKKEIGIRKVMGASIRSLLALLSREYLRLIVIAIFIAVPISYYSIAQWLTGFAYRIEVQWWMLVLPGVIITCFAWLIISIQSVKTAKANPIDSLKYE